MSEKDIEDINNNSVMNPDQSKLSSKEKFIYTLASFPNSVLAGIFALLYVNFFWDNLQLEQFYFVLGQIIYMFINAFNDFFLGRMSDKTNIAKWGSRRLIYIKWGGPMWAFVFFMLWFPWSYTNQFIIFLHFVVSICAFDMFLTLVILVWMALLPELTENLNERNKIQFFNQIVGTIGAFCVIIAVVVFESNLEAFHIFTAVMAILCAGMFFFISQRLHERPELYKNAEIPGLKKSIKETFKSRAFVTQTAFKFFNYVNMAMLLQFVFVYLYISGFDIFTTAFSIYFIIGVCGLLGSGIYVKLAQKRSMQTLMIRGRVLSITISIIAFMIVIQPGAELLIWVFFPIGILIGSYNIFETPYLMLAVDDDEVQHGIRREGMFYGANAFFIKFADSVGPIIATSVLLYFGFVRNAAQQTSEAIIGIKFLFFIVPAIMNILGLICLFIFPLHGERLKKTRAELLRLHEEKERKANVNLDL